MNANRPTVIREFRLIGTTIDRKARTSPAPSTRAASTSDGGMPSMNDRMIKIPNGTPAGGVGDDQAGDGVEQADSLVDAVEPVGDHDPGDHLGDQDRQQRPVDPAEAELGQGVRARESRSAASPPRCRAAMVMLVTRLRPWSWIAVR